jgi:hypothetical protein
MLNACGARSGAGGGAQENAKAFLCALEMVAAALQYIVPCTFATTHMGRTSGSCSISISASPD